MSPGVYTADSTASITDTLTLDAEGDPDAVFIFQIGSGLTTGPSSKVELINGARACKVFWQVGSSATLDTNTTFVGNILALTSITAKTGATIDGRALARNGAVTLDTNTFTGGPCVDPEPTVTPTDPDPTETPTSSETPTATVLPGDGGPDDDGSEPAGGPGKGDDQGGSASGFLPTTGTKVGLLVAGGLLLLTAGGALMMLRKRARHS